MAREVEPDDVGEDLLGHLIERRTCGRDAGFHEGAGFGEGAIRLHGEVPTARSMSDRRSFGDAMSSVIPRWRDGTGTRNGGAHST